MQVRFLSSQAVCSARFGMTPPAPTGADLVVAAHDFLGALQNVTEVKPARIPGMYTLIHTELQNPGLHAQQAGTEGDTTTGLLVLWPTSITLLKRQRAFIMVNVQRGKVDKASVVVMSPKGKTERIFVLSPEAWAHAQTLWDKIAPLGGCHPQKEIEEGARRAWEAITKED